MKCKLGKTLVCIMTLLLLGGFEMAVSSEKDNLKLLDEFAKQVFVNKDLNNLDAFMHDDYIQHNPLVNQGTKGFYAFFNNWFSSIPDFSYKLKNIIANDEYVWVYGTYSGTHTSDWLNIKATNKSYSFDGVDIFRVHKGKLAEHWDVLDLYSLFSQLQVE